MWRAGGIHGVGQVQPGIDQGAVQVEDQQVHRWSQRTAAPVFVLRGRPSRATGLRRARARPLPRSYSTIFRCSVLRWMPSVCWRPTGCRRSARERARSCSVPGSRCLRQKNIALEQMLHQPVKFLFHSLPFPRWARRNALCRALFSQIDFTSAYVLRKPSFNSCGAIGREDARRVHHVGSDARIHHRGGG